MEDFCGKYLDKMRATNRVFIYNLFISIDLACLRDVGCHFKSEHTETVAICFGYPKTLLCCLSARY
jgi:hypothetical protein